MGILGAWELGEHNRSAGTYGGVRGKTELIPKEGWIWSKEQNLVNSKGGRKSFQKKQKGHESYGNIRKAEWLQEFQWIHRESASPSPCAAPPAHALLLSYI